MKNLMTFAALPLALVCFGCATKTETSAQSANPAAKSTAEIEGNNPLLRPWEGPYGGVPPFDQIKVEHFKPAIEAGILENRAEIAAITANPSAPTFENTVEALERSGETLGRVESIFNVYQSSLASDEFSAAEEELSPLLAAFNDELWQNVALFKRVDAVYNSSDQTKLTPEQQRLVWFYETRFLMNGAKITGQQKERVTKINQRVAVLQSKFSANTRADEDELYLLIDRKEDLAGLPASFVSSAAAAAVKKEHPGKWVVANTRSAMEPFLTYSSNRELREKAFRLWSSRGDGDNDNNNNAIVTEILKLRAERSKLLGSPSYAHWHFDDTMAKKPEAALDLLMKVWKPAVKKVREDVKEMQKIVDAEHGDFKIQPWDYRYYSQKVLKLKYKLDFELVRPYLQLENFRDAMFMAAGKLFGFKFELVTGIPVFDPSMSVYKVLKSDGTLAGLWYFDPYRRAGKSSGAWMTNFREQYRVGGKEILPLVSNNSNFIPAAAGEPVTISWDDANTMFHEFGHAIHGLSANGTYKSLSGTSTARDFVEFPSQMNEKYLLTPEVLAMLKNKAGEPLPQELIKKLNRAQFFNKGFDKVEQLSSAIVDIKLHLVSDQEIDPKAFEAATLKEIGMPSEIIMRHRIPHFNHLFADEGYSAGYYGYLWAEVLDHDAFEVFTKAGGPYDPVIAKKYHDEILSIGNTIDPDVAYKQFRGRGPKVDALLRALGFK